MKLVLAYNVKRKQKAHTESTQRKQEIEISAVNKEMYGIKWEHEAFSYIFIIINVIINT